MSETMLNVNESIRSWQLGAYKDPGRKTQIAAGWYDWFCTYESLARKTDKLFRLAFRVLEADRGRRIDGRRAYLWFKNNCPVVGRLYDDFRFADLETGEALFTVIPSDGHEVSLGVASVWGRENGFEKTLVEGTWAEVIGWFRAGPPTDGDRRPAVGGS